MANTGDELHSPRSLGSTPEVLGGRDVVRPVGDPTAWPLLIGPAASPLADPQAHPAPCARSRPNVAYDTPALLYDDLRRHARGDRMPSLGQWISPPFDPKPCPNSHTHPVEGGSCNDYDYVCGDPVNSTDVGGTCFGMGCARSWLLQRDIAAATANFPDSVKEWNGLAQRTLKRLGIRVTPQRVYQIFVLIQGETGGDPTAVNTTDSNARAGTPSTGLVQVIQPTFDMYRSPDLPDDLFDPAANLYAGLAYGIARYGSIEEIPGIKSVMNGGIYEPY